MLLVKVYPVADNSVDLVTGECSLSFSFTLLSSRVPSVSCVLSANLEDLPLYSFRFFAGLAPP